ncbi:hypothetical protein ACLKA6_011416 [Drosophila palustris]
MERVRQMLNYKYLTRVQIDGFDNYKYSSIDTSPLSQYVMHPFWNWLVKFFPRWFAPNLMTFLGFLFSVMNLLLLSYYDWNFEASSGEDDTTPIPRWVWIACAINIFVAYTLDGIDGKQARRIGLSGPLGELFDHGLDSYTAMLIPTCLYSIFGRSKVYSVRPMRMYYVCMTVYFNFFVSHWEKYNTGILYLPWGYDLSMWGSTAMYLVTWWMGFESWKYELKLGFLGTLPLGNIMEVVLHVSAMANLPLVIINVYNSYKNRTGRLLSPAEALRPMWPFITYFVLLMLWPYLSPNDIMERDPRAMFMLSGTIFSNVSKMPPFCCGGRRCAADIKRRVEGNSETWLDGEQTASQESPITVTEAESPLTLKFYARHDWPYFNCTDDQIKRMRDKFEKDVQKSSETDNASQTTGDKAKKYEPKHATAQPMTENQIYGWYQHRAYRYLKKDRGIFVFPREGDPLIKIILASNLSKYS